MSLSGLRHGIGTLFMFCALRGFFLCAGAGDDPLGLVMSQIAGRAAIVQNDDVLPFA